MLVIDHSTKAMRKQSITETEMILIACQEEMLTK